MIDENKNTEKKTLVHDRIRNGDFTQIRDVYFALELLANLLKVSDIKDRELFQHFASLCNALQFVLEESKKG